MNKINESYYEIKKSKFYGYYYEVNNILEVNEILEKIKKENKKAKHIVYVYKINNVIKKTDDKEPVNTAGKPILDIINKKELNNILIVVVRYFGGILLGKGPLTRAYVTTTSKLF